MGELGEERLPIGSHNWCFVEADGVYLYCFSMIVHGFAEATIDPFVIFTFLTKQAFCAHRNSTLAQTDDKPPWRNQVGDTRHTVKMHTK